MLASNEQLTDNLVQQQLTLGKRTITERDLPLTPPSFVFGDDEDELKYELVDEDDIAIDADLHKIRRQLNKVRRRMVTVQPSQYK